MIQQLINLKSKNMHIHVSGTKEMIYPKTLTESLTTKYIGPVRPAVKEALKGDKKFQFLGSEILFLKFKRQIY